MRHSLISITAFALVTLFWAGCATVFTGTEDEIYINSDPEGARIFVDGIERGQTPDYLYIKRTIGSREITLKLNGYEARTFYLQKEFNAVSLLNILIPVGFIVDAATGSLMKYQPKGYDISLDRKLSLNVQDLERDEEGNYYVPYSDVPILIEDSQFGFTILVDK